MNPRKPVLFGSFLLCCGMFVAGVTPLAAQSDVQALEDHMRQVGRKVAEKRDSAVGVLIQMTDEQEQAFRPIQKAYYKEMKKLGKTERSLLREFSEVYDSLDASTADELSKRFFDAQRERLAIAEKYLQQISDEVSPVVAVQFLQLQRRFETELEMERLKYSPLAE
jgi:Spy/CpxP family protein refolding chaperone